MIYHIGGSSKRTTVGADIGTTDSVDASLSPKGRRLIGKIGIGLFSVSQLTSHFQIITKTAGSKFRLVSEVILRTYSEDEEPIDGTFESGRVSTVAVPADDVDSHGTEIILLEIRPRARELLQSKDRWERWKEDQRLDQSERDAKISAPIVHSGYLSRTADDEPKYEFEPALPWDKDTPPSDRLGKLFQALAAQVGQTTERPELAITLDSYLAMLWTLSLSAPVKYLERHPFDTTAEDGILIFQLLNQRGKAAPVSLKPKQTVRDALGLTSGGEDPAGGFSVYVDEVELKRPISFRFWPAKKSSMEQSMLFVGSYKPDLSGVREDIRGGNLAYEGYFFWNGKIVPKENNGVLVRINGSSGALFDDMFMKYQVSEQNRLRQITAEIFVRQGLDAALNIDRESFNFAHPHYQILSNWLHRGLRQLMNTHKDIGDKARDKLGALVRAEMSTKLEKLASSAWVTARREPSEQPPEVHVADTQLLALTARQDGALAVEKEKISAIKNLAPSPKNRAVVEEREGVLKAIVTVLDGFGVLSDMPFERQHELLDALMAIYYLDKPE